MAQRRMFSKKIISTDLFLDMPMSAQCFYFHLNMEADDDGFLGNVKTVRRQIGASEDDLKILIAKEFVLPFESGVVVIKDWKIHNYIRKDTYNATIYAKEKSLLTQNATGAYGFHRRIVDDPSPQDRLKKERVDKERLDKKIVPKKSKLKPIRHKYGEYKNVLLSDQDIEELKTEFSTDWEQRIERVSEYCASQGKSYQNYLATIRNWAKRDEQQLKRCGYKNQPSRQELIPAWTNHPIEEKKLSAERQAALQKELDELLADDSLKSFRKA